MSEKETHAQTLHNEAKCHFLMPVTVHDSTNLFSFSNERETITFLPQTRFAGKDEGINL